MPVDVQALGADFVAFTGHKMCGPTGIGVLWGRSELLEALPPFLGGGEMIETVTMAGSTYAAAAAQVRGGHAADRPGGRPRRGGRLPDRRSAWTRSPRTSTRITGVRAGAAAARSPACASSARRRPRTAARAISFALGDIHPHDVGQVLDEQGIAVRVGHHCARPVCLRYGVPATTRASFYLYTTPAEVDALVDGLEHVKRFFTGREVPVKLESMYQEIILDHYRHPHHKGLREPFDAEVHHVNPTCGDEVTLRVQAGRRRPVDGRLLRRRWAARSARRRPRCMTDLRGRQGPVDEAHGDPATTFLELMQSKGDEPSARRGRARGRGRVRRRLEVPGPGQVRAAGLDGVEGRDRPGACR